MCDLNQRIGQCDIEKISEDGNDSNNKGMLGCTRVSGEVRIKIIGCQVSKDGYVEKDEEGHVGFQKRIFVGFVRLIGIKTARAPMISAMIFMKIPACPIYLVCVEIHL